jgi:hypothetical protein
MHPIGTPLGIFIGIVSGTVFVVLLRSFSRAPGLGEDAPVLDESTSTLVLTLLGVLLGLITQALSMLGLAEYRAAVWRAADRKLALWRDLPSGARLNPTPDDLATSPWLSGAAATASDPELSKPLLPASTLLSELALFIGLLAVSGLFRPSWGFLIGAVVTYLLSLGLFVLADTGKIPNRLPGLGDWFG